MIWGQLSIVLCNGDLVIVVSISRPHKLNSQHNSAGAYFLVRVEEVICMSRNRLFVEYTCNLGLTIASMAPLVWEVA